MGYVTYADIRADIFSALDARTSRGNVKTGIPAAVAPQSVLGLSRIAGREDRIFAAASLGMTEVSGDTSPAKPMIQAFKTNGAVVAGRTLSAPVVAAHV